MDNPRVFKLMICKSLTETLWDASTVLQQFPNN
ncbi:BnaCnng18350D [Brassica napus]|nr:BnaCnng18350D [Brassica napus]